MVDALDFRSPSREKVSQAGEITMKRHWETDEPAMVKATGINALVLDTVQFYAELGPVQLGMPYIQVAAAVHFDFSGHTPLCLYGWPHQTTAGRAFTIRRDTRPEQIPP